MPDTAQDQANELAKRTNTLRRVFVSAVLDSAGESGSRVNLYVSWSLLLGLTAGAILGAKPQWFAIVFLWVACGALWHTLIALVRRVRS